jgi:EmrB/QacA subfamily drug resistance transporter
MDTRRFRLRVGDKIRMGETELQVTALAADASHRTVVPSVSPRQRSLPTQSQMSTQPEPDPRRFRALVILAVANFMVLLDNTVVTVALPSIQTDLNLGRAALEWVISGYALTFAVFLLTGGKLADLLGRRRLFMIGLAIFTAASLACGLAPTGPFLITARVVQGLGAALMLPATLAVIPAIFPVEERAMAIGIWTGTSGLGIALGPLIGGAIIHAVTWNWIFFVNVPIGTAGLLLGPMLIAESRDQSAERALDLLGLATSGVALAVVTFALIEGPSYGWGSVEIAVLFGVGGIALVAFIAIERVVRVPLLDLGLFRSGAFAGANIVALFVGLAMLSVLVYISVYLQRVLAFSALRTGLVFLPMTVLIILIAPLSASLGERYGPRWLLTVGLMVMAAGILLMSRISPHMAFVGVMWRLMIAGVGIGIVMAPMTDAALGSAPIDQSGVASGLLNTCRQFGGAIGIAVVGAIVQSAQADAFQRGLSSGKAFVNGLSQALRVCAVIAVVGAVIAATLIRNVRSDGAETDESAYGGGRGVKSQAAEDGRFLAGADKSKVGTPYAGE